jgi:glycerophosphoryl diester phosphodiesterase
VASAQGCNDGLVVVRPHRPAVIAHRGASASAVEHTLEAYQRAIDEGADGLECDVRLTRDGVLVCVHDRRVDRTSNGRGALSALELADLEELDFGLATPSERPDREAGGVLTLERLLEVVAAAPRSVDLAIETKHPTRYTGLVELELADLLARFGQTHPVPPVRVMSFAVTSLRRLHLMAPALPTVLLLRRLPLRYRDGWLPDRIAIAGPSLGVLRNHPDYVQRAQRRGNAVHVWTVNDPEDVAFVDELGVDAIITDRPSAVIGQLAAV